MKIFNYFILFAIIPAVGIAEIATPDPDAIPEEILGLHPIAWPIIAIGYFALQIADSYISEKSKAEWPAIIRQGWDLFLRNVGKSRNIDSVDSDK